MDFLGVAFWSKIFLIHSPVFTGGYGVAFTIVSSFKEVRHFTELVKEENLRVRLLQLDEQFPPDLSQNDTYYSSCVEFKVIFEN